MVKRDHEGHILVDAVDMVETTQPTGRPQIESPLVQRHAMQLDYLKQENEQLREQLRATVAKLAPAIPVVSAAEEVPPVEEDLHG